MNKPIYFDNAASTPLSNSVIQAIRNCSEKFYGNPSSIHNLGLEAKDLIDEARDIFSDYFSCSRESVVFNSGATEGNNHVLKGLFENGTVRRIVTSKIEHKSILKVCSYLETKGAEIVYLDVDDGGKVVLDELEKLDSGVGTLVTVSAVNNEFGTIQDYRKIHEICMRKGFVFHSDCVQAIGNINADWSCFDIVTVTAHKIHGPKGIGAIINFRNIPIVPLMHGGGQENAMRSGTENTIGIYAFAIALSELKNRNREHIAGMKKYIIDNLGSIGYECRINGKDTADNIISVAFPGFDADSIVTNFSNHQIYISSGSACLANRGEPSLPLSTLLKSDSLARATIRISLSDQNTLEECEEFIKTAKTVFEILSVMDD